MLDISDRVIFKDIDIEYAIECNLVPVMVPPEFRTIKDEYHRAGQIRKYIITRFPISTKEIITYNRPDILFEALSETEHVILTEYCNGEYNLGELDRVIGQKFSDYNIKTFRELLTRLTRQRTIYWLRDKSVNTKREVEAYFHKNFKISSFATEILYSYIYRKYGIPYSYVPGKVSFVITGKCNASCITCYRGSISKPPGKSGRHELTLQEFCTVIDELNSIGTDRVKFLGGEPFLRQDIFELIEEVHRNGIPCEISSNGILLSQDRYIERLKSLKQSMYTLQISIDGMHEGQARQRKGAGFEKVIASFRKLKANGISFSTNTIISKINMNEIEDLIRLFAEYDINCRFQIMKGCGTGLNYKEFIPTPAEKIQIIDNIDAAKTKYGGMVENSISLHPFMNAKSGAVPDVKIKYHRCRAFTYSMAISPEGFVMPCEFLEPHPVFIDNHVTEETIMNTWHRSPIARQFRYVEIKGKCSKCRYSHTCEMGCFAEIYPLTGDLGASDPTCWYNPLDDTSVMPIDNSYIYGNCGSAVPAQNG